jgi:hypothetical protein
MFEVFFAILLIVALFIIFTEVIMRVRLSKSESSQNRPLWWVRGGDEVDSAFEEVFPHALLLRARRYAFWLFVVCCLALIAFFMLKRI